MTIFLITCSKLMAITPPFRRVRDCQGGGLMTFIRSDIPSVRREELESPIEMACTPIGYISHH